MPADTSISPARRADRRHDVLARTRRLRDHATALEDVARRCERPDRTIVAQLRDDVARASTELLDDLEAWLHNLDAHDW